MAEAAMERTIDKLLAAKKLQLEAETNPDKKALIRAEMAVFPAVWRFVDELIRDDTSGLDGLRKAIVFAMLGTNIAVQGIAFARVEDRVKAAEAVKRVVTNALPSAFLALDQMAHDGGGKNVDAYKVKDSLD